MTRINVGVRAKFLSDEHLRAEHREIKRICNRFLQRFIKNKFDDIPSDFTLGKGHELFFVNKGLYTLERYKTLYDECVKRGFNVTPYHDNWDVYNECKRFFKDYIETNRDKNIIIERIYERIDNSTQKWHYYGKYITNDEYKNILIQ